MSTGSPVTFWTGLEPLGLCDSILVSLLTE